MTLNDIIHNPWIWGTLVGLGGSLLAFARNIPSQVQGLFLRTFTSSIKISNFDDPYTYEVFRSWLNGLEYSKKARNLTVVWDSSAGGWLFTPAPGLHFMTINNRLMWVFRHRDKPQIGLADRKMSYEETIQFRVLTRSSQVLRNICDTVKVHIETINRDNNRIWIKVAGTEYWRSGVRRSIRPLESVILPAHEMERIVSDIEWFRKSEDRYREIGAPYRRGWLLTGPPGTGKTSLITALASKFKASVYILPLSDPERDDSDLIELVTSITPGSILLLEDIDAAFNERTSEDGKGITFSGLLNALDGVSSPEGVIIFMTTNHPERLDPALIRPGRIDQRMDFGPATDEQISRYIQYATGRVPSEAELIALGGKTMAEIQIEFLKKGPENTILKEKVAEALHPRIKTDVEVLERYSVAQVCS